MPRRPAFLPATAAICALVALTACQGSPEAGRPNTTAPTQSSYSPTPSETPSAPRWTAQEQTAITAAKTQYSVARAAIDAALGSPTKAKRDTLEKAGNGGEWIITVLEDVTNFKDYGWYQTGSTKVSNTQVASVNLKLEQPEVRLVSCIDSSGIVIRFQKNGKPVPMGPGTSKRQKVSSRIVYAPSVAGGAKRWWLIAEQELSTC